MADLDWRGLSAEALERQFNPRANVPDFERYQAGYAAASEATRAALTGYFDLAYGDTPLQTVDLFPTADAAGAAPVHIFFHGGFWRAQDKANFAFVARPLVAAGICAVVANYDLCPAVTLDDVVIAAIKCIAWTHGHARDWGADPERLTISGHSAGGHLAAIAIAYDWAADGLPADLIKGIVPISGIFEPEPARRISLNAEIQLTAAIAARNDALARAPTVRCPVAAFTGGAEPPHWIAQTERYGDHLRRHGLAPEVVVIPGRHHFDILDDLAEPSGVIAKAVVAMARA